MVFRIDKSSLLKRLLRAGLKSASHAMSLPGRHMEKALPNDGLLGEIVALNIKPGSHNKKLVLAVLGKLADKGGI